MLARALLKTSLLLWLVQNSLQGGVGRPTGGLGRPFPGQVVGVPQSRVYTGGKPGKAGPGRYLGGYAPRSGLKQGYGTALGGYGAGLGAGLGLGNGLAGRGYNNGYRYQPGYGAGGYPAAARGFGPTPGVPNGYGALSNGGAPSRGNGAKATKQGYSLGPGVYPGAGLTNGYRAGLRPGTYPQTGRVGKQTGVGNVYGINGYGDGYGYGAELGNGAGVADGAHAGFGAGSYGGPGLGPTAGLGAGLDAGLGAGLGAGFTSEAKTAKYGGAGPGSVIGTAAGQPVVSAGLGTAGKVGGYGGSYAGQPGGLGADAGLDGGAGQLPYNGAPVIPAGLDGDNGYPYETQQLSLGGNGGNGGKLAYGYGAALGAGGQGPYGVAGKDGRKYGAAGYYGNGIKG
ncbi:fibroin heavy chain isoform X8 [Tachysurus vachellii]|uniref:fibroin heavy chain isoform X8 n=1 Tax=Tachysurus vachellii TaxID=175792 RepID=UPI00296A9C6D|nr:fibroin heavy chain isoform X8 [Tachysurus vachellii]